MSVDFDVVDALAGLAEDLRSEGDFVARLRAAVVTMKQERDEARAEVERLKGQRDLALALHEESKRLYWVDYDAKAAAFRRGAEAMREAMALAVLPSMAPVIRALPLPEEKP